MLLGAGAQAGALVMKAKSSRSGTLLFALLGAEISMLLIVNTLGAKILKKVSPFSFVSEMVRDMLAVELSLKCAVTVTLPKFSGVLVPIVAESKVRPISESPVSFDGAPVIGLSVIEYDVLHNPGSTS